MLSVQSLEHVPDPERVLAEVARVLEPDGVALFVTPNRLTFGRPDEIIDPYHYVEFDAGELRELCRGASTRSRSAGCSAPSATWSSSTRSAPSSTGCSPGPAAPAPAGADRARRRAVRPLLRRAAAPDDPRAAAIVPDDFQLRDEQLEEALDLCAICSAPKPR